MFQDLKAVGRAFGMPTTLLIDPQGCEIGTLAGPAEWASDDAVKLIEAALGRASAPLVLAQAADPVRSLPGFPLTRECSAPSQRVGTGFSPR